MALSGLLVVQLEQGGDGLVLLLAELDDDPAQLQRGPPGEAQVSGGVWKSSEGVRTVWWSHAGGHDRRRRVELETSKSLTRRNQPDCEIRLL